MTQAHLTPAEAEALKAIEAAEAAGNDPFGDLDDDTSATTTSASASAESATADQVPADQGTEQPGEQPAAETATNEAGQASEAAATEATGTVDESVLSELADPLGILQPAPPTYRADIPADIETNRTNLMTEKAEAFEKLMAGEIDAKEFAAVEIRVTTELGKLDRQLARAETLAEINQQAAGQYEGLVIAQIVDTTKSVLDYTKDATAQRQFDTVMAALRVDPANASKSFAELAGDANKTVLAMRGLSMPGEKSSASSQEAPAQQPGRKPAGNPPPTLRGIPTAATPNAGGGVSEQLANLSGQAYEAAFAKLSPAQQAALLGE